MGLSFFQQTCLALIHMLYIHPGHTHVGVFMLPIYNAADVFFFEKKNAYCYPLCWFYSNFLHFEKLWSERTRSLAVCGCGEEQGKSPPLKLIQGNGGLQVGWGEGQAGREQRWQLHRAPPCCSKWVRRKIFPSRFRNPGWEIPVLSRIHSLHWAWVTLVRCCPPASEPFRDSS